MSAVASAPAIPPGGISSFRRSRRSSSPVGILGVAAGTSRRHAPFARADSGSAGAMPRQAGWGCARTSCVPDAASPPEADMSQRLGSDVLGPLAWLALVALLSSSGRAADIPASPAGRPNILWISAEDISAGTLGCYGGPARTPRIDSLAAAGLRFDHAFSAAPVCAPSRSAIITGVMPTTLGSLPMRCRATPPRHLVGFPRLLRDAGWFCTNAAKTDYNLSATFDPGWHESNAKAHWRHRPDPRQPFFAVFNLGVTHESGLFEDKLAEARREIDPAERHDP
ncbi:MAG TPA: hypothetical protein DC048_15590, partial [Planctomycetaceae bacterium]|nr:hypothetical protein [Planctomycetaceae bacterium]